MKLSELKLEIELLKLAGRNVSKVTVLEFIEQKKEEMEKEIERILF